MRWLVMMIVLTVCYADDLQDVLLRIEHAQKGADSYVARLVMTSYEGETRTGQAVLDLFVKGMNLSIARYREPLLDKGKAVLQRGSDYWMYFPKTRQSVKISARQRLFGDANTGDIVKPPLLSVYSVQRVSNQGGQDIFELIAKTPSAPYQRILLWWDNNEGKIMREDFYTRTGVFLKRARYLGHTKVGDYFFATKVEITDGIQTNRRTVIEMTDIRQRDLSERMFYPEMLGSLPEQN